MVMAEQMVAAEMVEVVVVVAVLEKQYYQHISSSSSISSQRSPLHPHIVGQDSTAQHRPDREHFTIVMFNFQYIYTYIWRITHTNIYIHTYGESHIYIHTYGESHIYIYTNTYIHSEYG